MYAAALLLSAATTAGTTGVPFFQLGQVGPTPIQWFGVIVATGVLIGAAILRRYAEWHKVSDDTIRGITGWITITGFIGAHVFDVIMYQQHKPWFEFEGIRPSQWPLMLRLWDGISSYGGFVGGAMGFAFFVWWKRLPARLLADIAVIGLLPAFSIGRIGCTVVSDHIGAAVDPNAWYAFLAMPYPRGLNEVILELQRTHPGTGPIHAWNLGLVEFLYLVPVNALILWLGFRRKRVPAGFITVLTGVLYAPVRFFLDYLRPENSDPRHLGFTFAQWASLLAFGVAVYVAARILKNGKPAETLAPTSREAQDMLRTELKEVVVTTQATSTGSSTKAKVDPMKEEQRRKEKELEAQRAEERRKKEEADEAEAQERRRKQDEELAKKTKSAAKGGEKQPPGAEAGGDLGADEGIVDPEVAKELAAPAATAEKGPPAASGGKKKNKKK